MIVAQLSDIHAAPSNDNMLRLARAVSWLAEVKPDAVVVSGDLIDEGWTEGYAEIGARLDVLNCPVLVVPGNSDNRRALSSAFTNHHGEVNNSNAVHFRAEFGAIRLVGLDTSLSGSAAGDVAQHLDWLKRALDLPGAQSTLIFTHHHVVPCGIPPMDAVIAQGREELAVLLTQRSLRPLAISSGHVHRPMSATLAAIPTHICGSICAANPLWFGGPSVPAVSDPPMIMVHWFSADGLVSSHVGV
ncbi:metallophosphoesterase [Rhizobium tropici]|uniref:Metallophosphoesterase n=1 Tax=Rhizobium tropici TaxID=398 RepID=A0A5B0WAK7_RHITR|nr:metallophosphoesterase [Rhizobium tropici]KAA1183936.1 metallophosphoesterase [Rhizobium tropici]